MSQIEVVCPACKTVARFEANAPVPFRAECEKCSADLHVCVTCRFHDRYVENECREDQADPVATKDRRNLCEYWRPLAIGEGGGDDEAARAKAKLAAAFGLKAPVSPSSPPSSGAGMGGTSAADEAKRKLEELFKKKG